MFDLLPAEHDTFNADAIASRLNDRFSETASLPNLAHLIGVTLQVAKNVTGKGKSGGLQPQHHWLFELAGRVKGALPQELRDQVALSSSLAPLALLLVDAIDAQGDLPKKGRLDWTDEDAVLLEFDEIWTKRKFPKGSPFMDEAIDFALRTPLPIPGNKHFVRVLSVAYHLQTRQPELPILIPVNPEIARKLGTTAVTLGTAISKALREGYLQIVDGHFDIKAGKARSFRFNFDHPMIEAVRRQAHQRGAPSPAEG